jgi:putative Holliday junction resolvase
MKNYLAQEDVEAFVVGMPLRWDQSDTHATPLVKAFVEKMKKKFSQPVHLVDEQFTSKMARDAQIQGGMKKKDRRKKENLDKISAVIILQSYLEDRIR